MRNKILMTLALLLTAVTGAWAQTETPLVTIQASENLTFTSGSKTFNDIATVTITGNGYVNTSGWGNCTLTVTPADGVTITSVKFYGPSDGDVVEDTSSPFEAEITYDSNISRDVTKVNGTKAFDYGMKKIEVFGTAEPPIEVTPGEAANTWTFTQPAYDVVLTPRYAAATLYENDGETEKQAYETLKEAFANVQDGDVIKLDWDVTLTEDLATPTTQGGVKFTIDFNGYTLDAGTYLYLANAGDELTFTDTSGKDKLGGLKCIGTNAVENAKYIFDSGRYKFGQYSTAESMNALYATTDAYEFADGKEFVDIANGPDADDFNLTVDYKSFELTIGAGRFATFYANQNVALDAETPAGVGLYTITLIEEDSETGEPAVAYLGKLTGVVEKETPMLVYNGTDAQQTVKIKVTPDEADAENESISPLENFMGTAVAKTFTEDDMAAADYYALSGGKLFVPVYEPGTIGKNQCWLQFNQANGAPARGITLVFEKEEATEVTEVSEVNEAGDGAWYDLSGRKLNAAPIKGVYIKDGKKVVIK